MDSHIAEEIYKHTAKRTMLVLCLLVLIYLSAGPLSLIIFECKANPKSLLKGIGTVQQNCEIYRPFFLLELITSEAAVQFMVLGFLLSSLGLVYAYRKNKSHLREICIIALSFFFALSVYYYFSFRTLQMSDIETQRRNGVLSTVEFQLKCPWRGFECLGFRKPIS